MINFIVNRLITKYQTVNQTHDTKEMDSSSNKELIILGLLTKYPDRIKKQLHVGKDGNSFDSHVKGNKFIFEDGKPKMSQLERGNWRNYDIIFEEEYIFLGSHCYNIDEFTLFMKGKLKKIECIPEKSFGRPNGSPLRGTSRFLVGRE